MKSRQILSNIRNALGYETEYQVESYDEKNTGEKFRLPSVEQILLHTTYKMDADPLPKSGRSDGFVTVISYWLKAPPLSFYWSLTLCLSSFWLLPRHVGQPQLLTALHHVGWGHHVLDRHLWEESLGWDAAVNGQLSNRIWRGEGGGGGRGVPLFLRWRERQIVEYKKCQKVLHNNLVNMTLSTYFTFLFT